MNELTRETKFRVLRAILGALLDAVKESGERGTPAGPMYAAVMSHMQLSQFDVMMKALEDGGHVRKCEHVYYFVKDL